VSGSALPAAVIFDMDGLMLDTEPISHRAWWRAAGSLGVAIDDALLARMIGRNYRDCERLIRESLGPDAPVEAMMREWHRCYDEALADGIPVKPGLPDLLDWLERQAVPRAVATSTRRQRALAKLSATRMVERFDAIVAGDEVPNGKPAPDIFLCAAARLAVTPQRCLVLEDSEPGVRAAIAAGMTPVLVPDLLPPSASLLAAGVRVAASLHEVHAWLAGGGGRSSIDSGGGDAWVDGARTGGSPAAGGTP
jgi:HAD superfamily hydrolase (TIGR01509 family)